jgi:hypothetical protein
MRKIIAIIGDTHFTDEGVKWAATSALAERLIDAGYRIIHGGLGDIARAASEGARKSPQYMDGDLVAILPGFDPEEAQGTGDIVLATGLDIMRNAIIVNSDAVIAIGGGAGTLSELAFAWELKRLVIAYKVEGWSGELGGKKIDSRVRIEDKDDRVFEVSNETEAIAILDECLPAYVKRHHGTVVRY